jgi:sugar phosphate permease
VIYAAVVSAPSSIETAQDQSSEASGSFGRLLFNPASWVLALVFATFNFTFMGYGTWAPSYFNAALSVNPETASFYASLSSLAIIPSTIIAGWVLDHLKRRHLVLIAAMLLSGFLFIVSFQLGSAAAIVPYMLVLGLVGGFIPTATFTLAPETMPDPRFAGLALGLVSVGQNLGMFFGPPIVGANIATGNWAAGIAPLLISMAIGVAASIILRARHSQAPAVITEVT